MNTALKDQMRTLLKNERGAASLLYVILISLILLVITPVILLAVSTDSSRNIMDRNTLMATQLSTSGIEAFIAYLDSYNEATDGERQTYFTNYQGFMDSKTFLTPEGIPVTYSLLNQETSAGSNMYKVTSTARVGTNERAREKSVKYDFNAVTTITETQIDPNNRNEVTEIGQNNIYAQNYPNSEPPLHLRDDLKAVIGQTLTYYRTLIPGIPNPPYPNITSYINQYYLDSEAVACNCSNFTQIGAKIEEYKNSTKNPLILKITNCCNWENNSLTLNWGTTKPVILIFEGNVTFGSGQLFTLNLTGDLIVRGNLTVTQSNANSSLNLTKSSNKYGNLIATGNISYTNPVKTNVKGTIYANNYTLSNSPSPVTAGAIYTVGELRTSNGNTITATGDINVNSFQLSGDSTIYAAKLVVKNLVQISNASHFYLTSDVVIGSLQLNTTGLPGITTTGDILVENDIISGNAVTLVAGGSIAAGGNISIQSGHAWDNSTIQTGGGTTSLHLADSNSSGGGGGGSGTGTGAWGPVRSN